MIISIFIDDREYLIEGSFNGFFEYWSYCHLCPLCLKVWAVVRIEGSPDCHAETTPCERCAWPWPLRPGIPGSLLQTGIFQRPPERLLLALPQELLLREFRVHLKALGISLYDLDTSALFRTKAIASSAVSVFEPLIARVLNGEPPSGS